MRGRGQSRVQAGERAGEAADLIANDAMPERLVLLHVLIGIDDDVVHLRREARNHPGDHRLAVQELQALVDAAHAPALAAGEDEAADLHALGRACPLLCPRSCPILDRNCPAVARRTQAKTLGCGPCNPVFSCRSSTSATCSITW